MSLHHRKDEPSSDLHHRVGGRRGKLGKVLPVKGRTADQAAVHVRLGDDLSDRVGLD